MTIIKIRKPIRFWYIMGKIINLFTTNTQSSGKHQVVWDGTNSNGVKLPNLKSLTFNLREGIFLKKVPGMF